MRIEVGKGDVQAAAVRIMRRAQWFLISLPIAWRRWAAMAALLLEVESRLEHCLRWWGWREWMAVVLYLFESSVAHDVVRYTARLG